MSPEQARGKPVDRARRHLGLRRGALRNAHRQAALPRRDHHGHPRVGDEGRAGSARECRSEVRRLLRACLQKEPKQRLQAIGDYRLLLDRSMTRRAIADQAGPPHTNWIWPSAAALLSGCARLRLLRSTSAKNRRPRLSCCASKSSHPKRRFRIDYLPLSPGRPSHRLYGHWSGRPQSAVGSQPGFIRIASAAGDRGRDRVFWSPDSRFLAFADSHKLKKIDVSGGPPITLCELPQPVGVGSWSAGGVLLVGGRGTGPLWRVPASGGPATQVTTLDPARQEGYHTAAFFPPRWPAFSVSSPRAFRRRQRGLSGFARRQTGGSTYEAAAGHFPRRRVHTFQRPAHRLSAFPPRGRSRGSEIRHGAAGTGG